MLVYVNLSFASEQIEPLNLTQQDFEPLNCADANTPQDCPEDDNKTLIITTRKIPFGGLKPTTQATSNVDITKHFKVAATLTELVEGIPGVAENSQPGLYQVISIRGVSRQRILSFVDGVRLSSERRAGVAASFIDPLLLENITVIRGPVSTYYGSGAIGGVTQLQLNNHEGSSATSGYKNLGNQQFQAFHWGDDSAHASMVRRQANDSRDINSNRLNTHFEQTAGYFSKTWQLENSQIDSWIFSSDGNDIGRSNNRFPNRIVNVPEEKHTIFKTSMTSLNNWSVDFYAHDQSMTTTTLRPDESLSTVINKSLDVGSSWQLAWEQDEQSNLLGLDFYSRNNVDTKEQTVDFLNSQTSNKHTLNNGRSDELALFYTYHKQIADYRFQLGGRYTVEKAEQFGASSKINNALTGFTGVAFDLSEQLEINLNIGNAFRFASLTERFFSGTTARGNVTGNPNLSAERALTYDLGFNWQASQQKLKASIFLTSFDDYIERVEITEDSLTFINIQQGTIKGLEAEYNWIINEHLDLSGIATVIEGKNSQNQPLSDIPSDRISLTLNYQNDRWQARLRLQHRRSKNDPGGGEVSTRSANILAGNISYQVNSSWNLRFYADNLLDDTYVSSSDDLSTLAAGRHFGFVINWQSD